MGSQNGIFQQELTQLTQAYTSIQDEHIRYFFSMMLQSVAASLAEARQQQHKSSVSGSREKQRPQLMA